MERFTHRQFRERIRLLISKAGSRKQFEEETELASTSVTNWLRPKANGALPSGWNLIQLVRKTSVSLNWLFYGVGPEELEATRTRGELRDDLRQHLEEEVTRRLGARARGIPLALLVPSDPLEWAVEQSVAAAEDTVRRAEELHVLLGGDQVRALHAWANVSLAKHETDPSRTKQMRATASALLGMLGVWQLTPTREED